MRLLPYFLVLAMAAPVIAWLVVDTFMVKGTSTAFAGGDLAVVVSLGAFMVVAFVLLSRWMDQFIRKTGG